MGRQMNSVIVTATIVMLTLIVSSCATHSRPITVEIPAYAAPAGSSALSSIPPVTVRIVPLVDKRRDPEGGMVTAAFGVPMGHIRFAQSPANVVGQVIIAELRAAGHAVTSNPADTQISGAVQEFEVHTDTTPVYWDVLGHIVLSLQLVPAGAPTATFDYEVHCTDRTYIWPSESVIAGVVRKCLDDFAAKLRNDARVAELLRRDSSSR